MEFTIRGAEARDAAAVEVLAAEFQAHLRSVGDPADFSWGATEYLRDGFGKTPAFRGLVAEAGAAIVGFLLFDFGYDTHRGQRVVFVIDLFVTKTARRQGVAAALMQRAAEEGKAHGAEMMVWCVDRANRLARHFYEKLGASYIDRLQLMSIPI
jgi:GNAT superfamily N-acetyltransferase